MTPMSDERLQTIKNSLGYFEMTPRDAEEAVGECVAEIERLRAELKQARYDVLNENSAKLTLLGELQELRASLQEMTDEEMSARTLADEMKKEAKKAWAQIAELSATLQEMTAACQQAVDCCPMCAADQECQDDVCGELRRVLELSRLRGAK